MDVVIPFQGSRVYIFAFVDKKLARRLEREFRQNRFREAMLRKGSMSSLEPTPFRRMLGTGRLRERMPPVSEEE